MTCCRKHIRLLRANHSDEDSHSSSSEQDDKSRAKLGNWFTGKSNIETMERGGGRGLVFPTSVYLDNLASSSQGSQGAVSTLSSGQSSPAGGDQHANMFEVVKTPLYSSVNSIHFIYTLMHVCCVEQTVACCWEK